MFRKNDLRVLCFISIFVGFYFYFAMGDTVMNSFGFLVLTAGSVGLIFIPVLIGMFFYNKEVVKNG